MGVLYISGMLSGSSGKIHVDKLWPLWFLVFTNCVVSAGSFPSNEADTYPLKCTDSDWLSRQEEQVRMPMSEMIYMTHSLENIECGVVFTQMNSEKQILLLFFMEIYPDIYLSC